VAGGSVILRPSVFLCSLKQLAQSLASLVQLRLRISDRASKNPGDFRVIETEDIVKNKYSPIAVR
jgi:hypothetical protein